jgi:6-pyruvoyltetrahydropterin/6-carboxytetrahydropterin synthase
VYTVCVRDHIMIAHSLRGEVFGPAQRLHGATYLVDVEFRRRELDQDGIVVDIDRAANLLREVLSAMNYRNLDECGDFAGRNTTTEWIARIIFDRLATGIGEGRLGPSALAISSLRVSLRESHVAWAAFEGQIATQ